MRDWVRRTIWVIAALLLVRALAMLVVPNVLPADSGELQIVVRDLGVAHPPGYPLYTILGHLFGLVATTPLIARLFGFDPASLGGNGLDADGWTWSTNLFSAVLAVGTLFLVGATARRVTRSLSCGVLAAAALLLSPTFLAQSIVANIRMPTALVTALLLYTTISWLEGQRESEGDAGRPIPLGPGSAESDTTRAGPDPATNADQNAHGNDAAASQEASRAGIDRGVVAIGVAAGLAVGHHPSLAPVALLVMGGPGAVYKRIRYPA